MNYPERNNQNDETSQASFGQQTADVLSLEQSRRPAATMPAIKGNTPAPAFGEILRRLTQLFARNNDGVLFIDHAVHNIRTTLFGGFVIKGSMALPHGVLLQGESSCPEGELDVRGTVIIEEGASVEIDIVCENLYNFGSYKGNAKVSGLLLNGGVIEGDFEYGSIQSYGDIFAHVRRQSTK